MAGESVKYKTLERVGNSTVGIGGQHVELRNNFGLFRWEVLNGEEAESSCDQAEVSQISYKKR